MTDQPAENAQPDQNQPAPDPIDYDSVQSDSAPGPESDPNYGGDTAEEVVGPDDTEADESDADGNDSGDGSGDSSESADDNADSGDAGE
jgi:hypothetical protein